MLSFHPDPCRSLGLKVLCAQEADPAFKVDISFCADGVGPWVLMLGSSRD